LFSSSSDKDLIETSPKIKQFAQLVFKNKNNDELYVNDLISIDKEIAAELAKFKGKDLYLN
jgi:hypothetical protein